MHADPLASEVHADLSRSTLLRLAGEAVFSFDSGAIYLLMHIEWSIDASLALDPLIQAACRAAASISSSMAVPRPVLA